ncbi:MAG: DNA translocase FtsK, partial [Chloroflexota bacterium]
ELDDDAKSPSFKPATPIGTRTPFGAAPAPANTGSNAAAKLPPPTSSSSTPFGAKPGGNAPVRPADKGKDADFDDEDDELDDDAKSPSFKPATPIGNRTPFGASPTNSASKPNPFGARPSGSATAKPADDAAKDDQKSESLKPATPIGNRSPFNAKPSSPFGSSPTARPVNNDDDEDEAEDDEPESFKPATPIGNRPMPAPTPSASFTRPVPKPGLATTPQFDEEDEEEDNDPKYVPIDDADEDLPRSNGPRPTVSGGVGTAPASMPRPADPVLPRSRPGQEPSKPPLGGSTGSSFSPFGQRPPATTTKAETKPEATINPVKAADPSMPAKQPESAQPPTSTVATSTPPASPSPAAPPLEGVIIRSKGGQNGEIPDYRQLLESGSQQKVNDEVLKQQAKIIEETLLAFSAPGKVVETNPGPTITQFGVEPDYLTTRQGKKIRIKVGQIARLDADLALALSARSIRIEAPVPGKGYVGIEVPNKETAVVSLRDVMDSEEFERINSKLRIGLGLSVDGAPIATDLTQMPHLLIAGTTGSGKSVCVNAIIACLLLQNSPDDLKMIMVDPKRVELTGYNGIPHLVSAVVVDLERIVGVLKWVTREMDERYKKFAQAGARNIVDYNGKIAGNQPKLPYLVVVIDELADLMMLAPDETEKVLTRLAQMARATGIHLIVSTQRPSVDVVTGLIKANFPARISFAVASSVDSRVILDSPGAEKLLGRGDMLFQSPDAAAPLRMQGVFVSDAEINRITAYWKGQKIEPTSAKAAMSSPLDFNRPAEPVQSRQERFNSSPSSNSSSSNSGGNFSNSGNQRVFGSPPSSSSIGNRPATPANSGTSESAGNASEDDEMYDEAVEMVQRAGKPSIQMLQRRLRIGYTRAARLIELMEKRGAISSADARSATANDGGDSEDNTKEA